MKQMQKYAWLIDTILTAGEISFREISNRWVRHNLLNDGRPLPRATFNRWREAINELFGISIECQGSGEYLYYISNPEEIEEDRLKKWMIDSFAVGNLIGASLSLRNRILIDEIPSGRDHLATLLKAMGENRVVVITYHPLYKANSFIFQIEPYFVKLFENRWYVIARNIKYRDLRVYCLDRIDKVEQTDLQFELPKGFDAEEYFSTTYGVVVSGSIKPQRIILRVISRHKPYLQSLPLHHSQRLISDCGEYADFELYLSPTYDFVMKLLQMGEMVEVIKPLSLRKEMRGWIDDMYELYKND